MTKKNNDEQGLKMERERHAQKKENGTDQAFKMRKEGKGEDNKRQMKNREQQ